MVKIEEEVKEIVEEAKVKLKEPPEERNTTQIHPIVVVTATTSMATKLFTVSNHSRALGCPR